MPVKILAFSGSSRRDSLNQKLLEVVVLCARAMAVDDSARPLEEVTQVSGW
jgi:hypothetical protein